MKIIAVVIIPKIPTNKATLQLKQTIIATATIVVATQPHTLLLGSVAVMANGQSIYPLLFHGMVLTIIGPQLHPTQPIHPIITLRSTKISISIKQGQKVIAHSGNKKCKKKTS